MERPIPSLSMPTSDGYITTHEFIRKWTEGVELPEVNETNLLWNIALAKAAEAQIEEYRKTLRSLKTLLNEV